MPRLISLLLALLLPLAVLANPAQEAAIDRLANKYGLTGDGPGAAVAIIEPGKPTVQRCYGLANVTTGARVTAQTTFELASLSKPFTSTLILLLHDRGQLSVEDDVRKYLPELPAYRPNRPIRVRHLLNHVSGLPEYFDFDEPPLPAARKFWNNEDYVPAFAAQRKNFPLEFAPGAKYEYCNSNYMLLAAIAARVSKKPFARVMQEELFQPLEMTSTFIYDQPQAVASHAASAKASAIGYRAAKGSNAWRPTWGLPPLRYETMLQVGDGAIWSNLEDLERWDTAVREKKLLKADTWRAALAPSKTTDGETNDYGYGWGLYRDDDAKLYGYGHDGDWSGFLTSYYLHLTTGRSYIVLSNRGNFAIDDFSEALLDAADARGVPKKKKK